MIDTDALEIAHLRECDDCGRITGAGEFPDWVNGVCEFCDPSIFDHPDNAWRM